MNDVSASGAVQASGHGRVDKPWGYELHWAITDRYLGKILHVRAGFALSLQYHVQKDETILVLSGAIDLVLDSEDGELETHRLTPGMSARIRPGRRHRMIGVEDSDVCEVSSPEIDDLVRLDDRYGREGTTAP